MHDEEYVLSKCPAATVYTFHDGDVVIEVLVKTLDHATRVKLRVGRGQVRVRLGRVCKDEVRAYASAAKYLRKCFGGSI